MKNDDQKTNGPTEARDATAGDFSRPPGSTILTRQVFDVEALQRGIWKMVGAKDTEEKARAEEADWREWNANESKSNPYQDFRIVRITETRDILSNSDERPKGIGGKGKPYREVIITPKEARR